MYVFSAGLMVYSPIIKLQYSVRETAQKSCFVPLKFHTILHGVLNVIETCHNPPAEAVVKHRYVSYQALCF